MTRRGFFIGAAMVAAFLAGVTAVMLPPAALAPVPPAFDLTWPVVRGAYHVHSQQSDGTGTIDEIAAAAARAGLQFVILTDHGDATRPAAPPSYRAGVLCIEGVEISTDDGHLVALDLATAPYPLRGSGRDVIDDVHRLGGFAFAAHPDSAKPELQWREWDAPFDGLEWLNADSEWRNEFWGSLGAMLLTYPLRPVETLAAMLDRPVDVMSRWRTLLAERRVPVLAAADAHARLGLRQATDPYEDYVLARVPSYEVSFGAFVNHVILPGPLTGDAVTDAAALMTAIREGHTFTSITGLAALSAFEAKATSGDAAATPGAYLDVRGPVAIEAAVAAPPGTTLSVLRDGDLVYETRESALRVDVGNESGAYWVEARLPSPHGAGNVPWILTNPIYVGLRGAHAAAFARRTATTPATERTQVITEAWGEEASGGSRSELRPVTLSDGTPALEWQFAIAPGARGAQYSAMRFPADGGLAAHDRVQLRARSDQPRRVWIQLRTPGGTDGARWGSTFHVATEFRTIELRFDEFRAIGADRAMPPPLADVDALLLVVDTVNSTPGSTGRITITDLWLAR